MSVERRKGGRKKDTKDAVDGEDVTETYNRLSKNKTPKPNRSMNHSPTSLLKKKKKLQEVVGKYFSVGSNGKQRPLCCGLFSSLGVGAGGEETTLGDWVSGAT